MRRVDSLSTISDSGIVFCPGIIRLTTRQRLVWRLWRGTATLFSLSCFMQRRRFWQPAAATRPRSCGGCRATTRQRLVWPLSRGTATVLTLSRFMQRRRFWQPAAATRPQSCGANEVPPSLPVIVPSCTACECPTREMTLVKWCAHDAMQWAGVGVE